MVLSGQMIPSRELVCADSNQMHKYNCGFIYFYPASQRSTFFLEFGFAGFEQPFAVENIVKTLNYKFVKRYFIIVNIFLNQGIKISLFIFAWLRKIACDFFKWES
jgi:hypothetical protein